MDIIKLAAIAVVTAVLALFVKQYRSDFAILISLCGGAVLLLAALPYFKEIMAAAGELAAAAGLQSLYMGGLFKIIAVAYVTEYGAALCRDAEMGALATKLEMAGKLLILALSMPIVTALFETVLRIIPT